MPPKMGYLLPGLLQCRFIPLIRFGFHTDKNARLRKANRTYAGLKKPFDCSHTPVWKRMPKPKPSFSRRWEFRIRVGIKTCPPYAALPPLRLLDYCIMRVFIQSRICGYLRLYPGTIRHDDICYGADCPHAAYLFRASLKFSVLLLLI